MAGTSQKSQIRHDILWDFDGTLAYRDGMWSATLLSLLNKAGINDIPIENIRPYLKTGFTWHNYEYSHEKLFNDKTWYEYYENYFFGIFIKLGIKESTANELSKNVITEYMDKTKWFIYDDVIEALEETIKHGFRNFILSNHIPELSKIVESTGLKDYFCGIYSSANIGYEKPNARIYEYILQELNIDKNACIIIGDSFNADIKGGENAGIKAILVRTENTENYKWYCKDLGNILTTICSYVRIFDIAV
jgi:putative hydrolase of the HAD superfamily